MKVLINFPLLSASLLLLGTINAQSEFCIGGHCDTCTCFVQNVNNKQAIQCNSPGYSAPDSWGCCGGNATPSCQNYCCSSGICDKIIKENPVKVGSNPLIAGQCSGAGCGAGDWASCSNSVSTQALKQTIIQNPNSSTNFQQKRPQNQLKK